jgi:3-phosphoshikimate 1-carboxyvinyltransferase
MVIPKNCVTLPIMNLRIHPPEEMIDSTVELPLSKSESNRMLIINALTPGHSALNRVAHCDDTQAMINALAAPSSATEVNIGAAGTAMRFLTAYFAAQPGRTVTLDGSERMRRRPIAPLVDALRALGANIEYVGEEGFPPLRIHGTTLRGGAVAIPASVSSQFISALLMVAPVMEQGLQLTLEGQIASRPYIEMTLGLMQRAGVNSTFSDVTGVITVEHSAYAPTLPPVEADWSAASYWLEIAAVSSGFVTLKGLRPHSLQGDSAITRLFEVTGLRCNWADDDDLELAVTPDVGAQLQADFTHTPDVAQTMAVTCCLLDIPFRFTGLQSLRIKETDRLAALQMELSKLGYILDIPEEGELMWNGNHFDPGEVIEPIATYDDHRMAMAFAPAALFYPGLQINNAEVVSKSYPEFWDDLRQAGFTLEEV